MHSSQITPLAPGHRDDHSADGEGNELKGEVQPCLVPVLWSSLRTRVWDEQQKADHDDRSGGVSDAGREFRKFLHSDLFNLWRDKYDAAHLLLDALFPFFLFMSGMLLGALLMSGF